MTDRKPALDQWVYEDSQTLCNTHRQTLKRRLRGHTAVVLASDLPPAILNATKEELAALAVFAEAMPELPWDGRDWSDDDRGWLFSAMDRGITAAIEAAKSTTAEEV